MLVFSLSLNRMRHLSWRRISFDRRQKFSRQALTQFFIAAARKIVAQVFLGQPLVEVAAQQAFDRVRHFAGQAAIPDRTRDRLMQSNGATYAKVIGILLAAIHLDFLPLDADVSDPVLAAAVGTSRDVQFQVLFETRQALFQFFDQPAGETLGLGNRDLAELRAAARHHATPEG